MKNILNVAGLFLMLGIFSCESSEDVSKAFDHEVPACTSLTLTANGQTKVIDDAIVTKLLWGAVPQVNLETISLPTITATAGSTVDISVVISDNEALKTAELSYSPWLFSKYINFANPEGDTPLTPQSYTFTAQITVPVDAVTTPWIETFYYNDGSSIKYIQPYHKLVLTLGDVNMNTRSIPIFLKVE
ncbi:MAG TPA: hypothetical protein DCQ26_00605 [Marinilabiliales bacterium]|jgi:hypothetical protein|nr:MAG: hypothetical protein A2W95_17820 [Bacteroidetes bacterium GWA2_40_14]OFX61388.1 MAG: hypothetical protein A2W84_14765 [Bacteroidetes bacterium GWC2_40_13]OFX74426.1 MAG: hypothetical protein A2W96_06795 [Bacteroidetes bacterium GWD2_40_43]OFX94163.1 MAG: hypothetical protein A2W97_17735 [Bacteroidetes bacterium GWE2_40_63]OFY20315.1 MAG: hypothetical protein A2W88_12705 [Bacteroidetes bacterium GWF2_40_13]OFZ31850.1 MAG: hypothetical protein A2437_07925 [Bacteroidetes bacterium RIFOXYC